MSGRRPSANDNGWRKRQAWALVRARGDGCWICREFGRPDVIDYGLRTPDPGSFEVDHLVPVSRGGSLYDPENLAATHRACNNWRKDRSVAEVRAIARRSVGGGGPRSVAPTTEW